VKHADVCGLIVGLAAACQWGIAVPGAAGAGPAGSDDIRLDVTARALQPGEVVRVDARLSAPAIRVSGSWPHGTFEFVPTDDVLRWQALIGLDVSTKPGVVELGVQADGPSGIRRATLPLDVKSRVFPERRLSVDERFSRPPASEQARIAREARRLNAIIAGRTAVRLWSGPFQAPVPGEPTSAFGRVSIVNGQRRSPHAGIDLRASTGTPVQAPAAGRVVLSTSLYYAGDTVIIDHGHGLFSLLAHLSRRDAQEGDHVAAGDVVGLSGATGRITGPHLHWGVRLAGALVDPLSLIAATR
jgi:murein DD-endopeptidase MepM/ murein hydrolase activator NlpD